MIVLSVGQCGFDDSQIAAVVVKELGAALERASSAAEAKRMMQAKKYDLVLVNRVFDGDGDSGVGFIGQIKKAGDPTAMMLVSNYADAQDDAVACGALLGFGKSALGSKEMVEQLRNATKRAAGSR